VDLANSRQEIAKSMPHNWLHLVPENAWEGFIDEDGVVRIGLWALQAWGDDLYLSYRVVTPTDKKAGYGFHTYLERSNQQWTVTSVSFVTYHPHR
jgi:hypothetical protein